MVGKASEKNTRHRVLFHGDTGDYFAIWLVNMLLTILTLGIYSAWATVRTRRYFYGNTEIDGDRFDYHAKPIQILIGKILVIAAILVFYILSITFPNTSVFLLLAFVAFIPWIIVRSWRYNALMTSYRGVRFNYHCNIKRAYWVFLLLPVLLFIGVYAAMAAALIATYHAIFIVPILTAILLVPAISAIYAVLEAMKTNLFVNNLLFGNTTFAAALSKIRFIKIALISLIINIPFLIVAVFLVCSIFLPWAAELDIPLADMDGAISGGMSDEEIGMLLLDNIFSLFLAIALLFLGGLLSKCYAHVAQRNYIFNLTTLEGGIQLHSAMRTWPYMLLMITNSLMVFFSGGWATPFAEIRYARYLASVTEIEGDLSLLDVRAHQETQNSALAEEAVQMLDLNVGI